MEFVVGALIGACAAIFGAYFGVWLQLKFSEKERRKDTLTSLLQETESNIAYLETNAKHITLYEDAYLIAKNSGNLRLLSPQLVKILTSTYLSIKNRNEILQLQRYTFGTVDWTKHLITLTDGTAVPFPKWLDMNTEDLRSILPKLRETLNQELRRTS